MKENLECYYEQKLMVLQDRLARENFPWKVHFI
jgi:hypothetical protein